jgi:hypothetical protein
MQSQGVCHETLPWLISFSLDGERALTFRMKIAIALVVVHLVVVGVCFGSAIWRPERSGLAPLFVLFADMPASLIIEPVRHALDAASDSYTGRLLVDAAVYSVIGTVWWFCVGSVVGWIISSFFRHHDTTI